MDEHRRLELEGLLEDLSYQVTAARSAGLARPEDLRRALRRMTKLIADLDAVAVTELAGRRDRTD